jgi:hypothetical protein
MVMDRSLRFDWRFIAVCMVAGAAILYAVLLGILHPWYLLVDFDAWKYDWGNFLRCIGQGAIGKCGGFVSKFPLAYLLNSVGVYWMDRKIGDQTVLLFINLLFLALPWLALALLKKDKANAARAAAAYAAAIALSPLPSFYVYSGALEIQSGIACGIFISGLVLWVRAREVRSRVALKMILAVSAFVFPLYKDTLAVHVLASMAASWALWCVLDRRWYLPNRNMLKSTFLLVGIPSALSLAFAAGYNMVRYATPLPAIYIAEAKATSPPLYISAQFLLGSLFSPNGGVLIFWFLPVGVAIFSLRLMGGRLDAKALSLAAALAALAVISFSLWWSPFGWCAWGDRLMIPSMLSVLVIAILTTDFGMPLRNPLCGWAVVVPSVPLLFFSSYYVLLPYLSQRSNLGDLLGSTIFAGPACAELSDLLENGDPGPWRSETYYACARERMSHMPMP